MHAPKKSYYYNALTERATEQTQDWLTDSVTDYVVHRVGIVQELESISKYVSSSRLAESSLLQGRCLEKKL